MEMRQVFHSMVDQAGVKQAYGEPVVSGQKTIIPVAQVWYGFGGGGGKNPQKKDAEGWGGGGGARVCPVGFLEITPEYSRFVPMHEKKKLAAALALGVSLGFVLGWTRCRRRRLEENA